MPTLSVEQTLRFAVSCRAPRANQRHQDQSRDQFIDSFMNVLGKVFGLERVYGTRVGNAQLRGVSGGEKKRVSISEVLASRALVTMWDSATRGLDSSSAVQYVKALRALTNLTQGSTLVTLYQASDSLWDLFDKVLLIDAGKLVYFGPTEDAIRYFEQTIGFERQPRQTATDYLNSCTDPVARKPREGFEGKVPTSPEEMEQRWKESEDKQRGDRELEAYKQWLSSHPRGQALADSTAHEREEKKKSAGSNYTISLWRQIALLTRRQTQLILRDRPALAAKYGGAVFQALIAGSAFYNQPYTTQSAFTFGGAAFLSILFMSLQGLAELTNQYQLRPILVRHQGFSFYRMSAFALAQVLIDAVSFVRECLIAWLKLTPRCTFAADYRGLVLGVQYHSLLYGQPQADSRSILHLLAVLMAGFHDDIRPVQVSRRYHAVTQRRHPFLRSSHSSNRRVRRIYSGLSQHAVLYAMDSMD